MNWADWAIVGIVALSSLQGMARGFVREAMSLAVWLMAIAVAFFFSEALASRMVDAIATPSVRQMAAFGSLFLVSMLIGKMIANLMGQLISAVGLKGFDRVLGIGFGMARGVIIVLVILVFMPKMIQVQQDPWWQESVLIPHVLSLEGLGRELAGWGMQLFGRE